ncbi:hypothetical protein DLAC_00592 [Tieghemostelium lacteum]|uniref:Uncharacterized protein n=1 Tax=Tieghemostelium lacteum TaxID=361077 RepID=A0A152AA53_TIELA|nr:hypothetical protein DLAC_00592 [Tieghemostelium lacteum]|eukprot:KYR03100.1 hypothetical protein DLAC_00592 [Tieghemostelium lacteum]
MYSLNSCADPYNYCAIDINGRGTCQRKRKLGENCNDNVNCESHLLCSLSQLSAKEKETFTGYGKCVEGDYLGAGEPCTLSNECNHGLQCLSRKCTLPPDQGCQVDTHCQWGYYCQLTSRTCQPTPTLGDHCTFACMPPYTCASQICIEPYSLRSPSPCSRDDQCNISVGLYCSSSYQCMETISTTNTSKLNCSSSDQCQGTEYCYCRTEECIPKFKYNDKCKLMNIELQECINSHQCPIPNIYNPQSCIKKFCGDLLCNYYSQCDIGICNSNYKYYACHTTTISQPPIETVQLNSNSSIDANTTTTLSNSTLKSVNTVSTKTSIPNTNSTVNTDSSSFEIPNNSTVPTPKTNKPNNTSINTLENSSSNSTEFSNISNSSDSQSLITNSTKSEYINTINITKSINENSTVSNNNTITVKNDNSSTPTPTQQNSNSSNTLIKDKETPTIEKNINSTSTDTKSTNEKHTIVTSDHSSNSSNRYLPTPKSILCNLFIFILLIKYH